MIRANKASLAALVAVAALVLAAAGATFYPRQADAQSGIVRTVAAPAVVSYSSYLVNQVVPTARGEVVKEVLPFPESSVFLVRTGSALTVWERQPSALQVLLDIPLDDNFVKVIFLDDKRTFIVQSRAAAKVYSVDRKIVTTKQN